jgi:very-short-patch-repair endonuclease
VEAAPTKQILGVQFYRQRPIGNYIVDFFAPTVQLVIEVDGAHHSEVTQTKYDKNRSKYLEQIGLKVLRFDDRQVLTQTDAVIDGIFWSLTEKS